MPQDPPWLDHPLFKALFQATPDMIFIHGPDGRIVDVNPQVEAVLGWSREEFLTLPPQTFMGDGYTAEKAFENLARARAGEALDFPWVTRAKCGEEIPVEVRLRPLALPRPGYVFALVHDQRLQREHRTAHERRRAILRRIAEAERSSLDPDRILHNVIDAVRDMFQADRAYLLHPLDPTADTWSVPVQSCTPEFAPTPGEVHPYTPRTRYLARLVLDTAGAIPLYPTEEDNEWGADRYQIRSSLLLAVRPRLGKPWVLGLHQCRFARRWTQAEQALFTELGERVAPLLDALTEQRQREDQDNRLSRFQRILAELARLDPASHSDLHHALHPYTQAAAEALGVQRTSIWTFYPPHQELRCEDLYQDGRHQRGQTLRTGRYPAYFSAVREGRTIAATDARQDPRTADFLRTYLLRYDIGAVLEAPIRVGGAIMGILRCEQCRHPRTWTPSEQAFAASLADQLALVLDYWHHRQNEHQLAEQAHFAHHLLQRAPVGYLLLDTQGRILEANTAFAGLLGHPVESLIGHELADLGLTTPTWQRLHCPDKVDTGSQRLVIPFTEQSGGPLLLDVIRLERGGRPVTAVFVVEGAEGGSVCGRR